MTILLIYRDLSWFVACIGRGLRKFESLELVGCCMPAPKPDSQDLYYIRHYLSLISRYIALISIPYLRFELSCLRQHIRKP